MTLGARRCSGCGPMYRPWPLGATRRGWPWALIDYYLFRVVNVWIEGRQLSDFATAAMLPDHLTLYGPNGSAIGEPLGGARPRGNGEP